jgi:hypothetical protein
MPGFEGPEWDGMNQSLLFGRMIVAVRIHPDLEVEDNIQYFRLGDSLYKAEVEYIFYPDNLPQAGIEAIKNGMGTKPMGDHYQPDKEPFTRLHLLPLSEFMKVFYELACRRNSYVVGFNLPFDLSRLALKVNPTNSKSYYNGFSFTLWDTPFRPRLRISHIGNKRAFIGWSTSSGKKQNGKRSYIRYKNRFIDLHTLIFALTSDNHSLARAARHYLKSDMQKQKTEIHGVITPEYLAYNRQDVIVTLGLTFAVMNDYLKHPIMTLPEKLFSPASLAKGYLQSMNIKPRSELQPNFPAKYLGAAMNAYYGGRVDTMIRKVKVPIDHTDFKSMYPTVNCLMNLWELIVAKKVEVVEDTESIRSFLEDISLERCFDKSTWPELRGMALIKPDGDLLPVRAKYGESEQIGQILYSSDSPQWYMLPDLVASVIRTGKLPNIIKAYRFVPRGIQPDLKPVKLQGKIEIDPLKDDFFRKVIEERDQIRSGKGKYKNLSEEDRETLQMSLKTLSNAGSYGIFAERHEKHNRKPYPISVYSNVVTNTLATEWEEPGKYFFAPLASLIASAARLMLSLLECEVTRRGGCYATTDTDSMMIVADQTNHDMTIQGRGANGQIILQTIRALSWQEVNEIAGMFERLNPYDRKKVPGSILKLEKDNYDEHHKQQRLFCYAIGPKRYCLFINGEKARLEFQDIIDPKESGLKFFLDPEANRNDPDNKIFVKKVWLSIINNDDFSQLPEANSPVVYQFSITTANLWKRFKELNKKKPYNCKIKPFNFILQASTDYDFKARSGQSLIAPYDHRPENWKDLDWIDYQNPETPHKGIQLRRIENYLRSYSDHPEYPYLGPDGQPCSRKTQGLLSRRTMTPLTFIYQGKATTYEDDIDNNIPDFLGAIITYGKPNYDKLIPLVKKVLADMPREFLSEYFPDKSYRTLYNWQKGKINPQAMGQLIEASIAYTRQYVSNFQDITTQELFKSFLSEKRRLKKIVNRKVKKISNSALHHKMNLNPETISRLRNGDDLHFEVLKRLNNLLNREDQL